MDESRVKLRGRMETRAQYEVIIIGCGIAGASLAHFLAERGLSDVLILEREEQPEARFLDPARFHGS